MGAQSLPPAWQLYLKDHRVSTFKNWPFLQGCACTPERMAAAGFIHCPTENEPNLAQCFFCFKELEGWEPDDDPMQRKPTPALLSWRAHTGCPESLLNDLARSCGDLVRRVGDLSALIGCVSIAPHLRHVHHSIASAAVSSSPPRGWLTQG
ncbi:unnamed protein product [Rangifer tarandus platyrhynchus]|uniref:Uncharacterized protein n=1 Tax=Rangifer tarandus platyrhynchus TaxID=3082113 RepID=A0AC60A288_RANTA